MTAILLLLVGRVRVQAAATHVRQTGASSRNSDSGYYTAEQARTGEAVYMQNCSSCHGANLEGLSGPPLAGEAFSKDVEFNKITAAQLFGFIATQMPYDRPGRLTKEQYEVIFAYILYRNHYPPGSTPFSSGAPGQVKLLPFPGTGDEQTGQKNAR